MNWLIVGGVVVVAAALMLIAYILWHALLLRYHEESDAHEIHTVKTKDGWDLKLFRYRPASAKGEPVFLCHGAFANHTNFTRPRGACLVDTLVDCGYDCWLIDLRGSRSSEPPLGRKRTGAKMDDFLLFDIPAALAFIRQATGYSQVHWIGHSLGGMLLYAYVLLNGSSGIACGTTLGSPIGFHGTNIPRHRFLLWLVRLMPGFAGGLMRLGARVARRTRPRSRVFPVNWNNLHPRVTGKDLFNMIETPPPQMARELAHWASSKQWRMNNGELDVAGSLGQLALPLFGIYGGNDPFVPVDEALEFMLNVKETDKQVMILCQEDGFVEDYNHVDLAFGKEGVEEVYEPIAEWMGQHMVLESTDERVDREGRAFAVRRVPVAGAVSADEPAVAAPSVAVEPLSRVKVPSAARPSRSAGFKQSTPKAAPAVQKQSRVKLNSAGKKKVSGAGAKSSAPRKSRSARTKAPVNAPKKKAISRKKTTAKKKLASRSRRSN